jgi:hypothetical protein
LATPKLPLETIGLSALTLRHPRPEASVPPAVAPAATTARSKPKMTLTITLPFTGAMQNARTVPFIEHHRVPQPDAKS